MPPEPKDPVDPKSFLLPKKEGGPSPLSAQRINAGALLAQEVKASEEQPEKKVEEKKTIEDPSTVHAVQTYTTDINQVVRSGNISAVTIAAAEAERRAKNSTAAADPATQTFISEEEKISRWRIALMVGGAVLIVAALGLVATLLLRAAPQPTATTSTEVPFMAVDQVIPVVVHSDVSRDELMTSLQAARQQVALSVGLVAQLYAGVSSTTGTLPIAISSQQLLAALSPDIPQDLLRTVLPVYLLGVHSFDENQTFLVLRVDSYQQAYSGLLVWEPNMQQELAPLFTRKPALHLPPSTSSGQAATSTSTTTDQFIQTGFVDKVVENHDARVVLNSAGDILLLWTFLDRNTVVITTNEYTLREVIRRVNTASIVPQP